jgi:hypothetical protein
MAIQFRPATRRQVKIKMIVTGPTNSGKTLGALHIANGLAPGNILMLDSEHDRADYYADEVPFLKTAPESHHPKAYIAVIHAAVAKGAGVLIIDSLSHCWLDVLGRKDAYDKANRGSNPWANWLIFGPEWDELLREILEAPIHIICTARSKMAHESIEQGGRKQVVTLGLAPQFRENTLYEFAVGFSIESSHGAQVAKDNTNLFGEAGKVWDLTNGEVPTLLRRWLSTAVEIERPTPETQKAIDDALIALPEAVQAKARKRVAARKQKGLPELEALELLAQIRALGGPSAEPAPAQSAAPTPAAPPATEPPAPPLPPEPSDSEAPAEHSEDSTDVPDLPTSPLSAACARLIMIAGKPVALGDLPDKSLAKLRPMAIDRGDATLVRDIDLVMDDRRGLAAEQAAAAAEEAAQRRQAAIAAMSDGPSLSDIEMEARGIAAMGGTRGT